MKKWYENAVFYELYTRSFRDANGDGFGDFAGVLEKLDYLADLGIDAIWLPPFYASPLRDGGYDISDYTAIDPRYGTQKELDQIFSKAHSLGIKIIIDLVINHTSDQHKWFIQSRKDPKGPYGDYYVWADDDKGYAGTRVIFSATEKSNWTFDDVRKQYFWHRFYKEQPDLNFDCPAVHKEIFSIVDFWVGKGVDGFRLDAIPFLYEREGTENESLPETHAFLAKLRHYLDDRYTDIALLAEACTPISENMKYFGSDNEPECNLCLNFPLMPYFFRAPKLKLANEFADICSKVFKNLPKGAVWSNFLRNHDFLSVELLNEDEVKQMEKWYASPQGIVNGGFARRLAPLFDYDEKTLCALTALLISLPGAPCWYYGDEILMADNPALPDRDSVRLPMPWEDVKKALENPNSFLNRFKEMLHFRRKTPALLEGNFEILETQKPSLLHFHRCIPGGKSIIFTIDFETLEYSWI